MMNIKIIKKVITMLLIILLLLSNAGYVLAEYFVVEKDYETEYVQEYEEKEYMKSDEKEAIYEEIENIQKEELVEQFSPNYIEKQEHYYEAIEKTNFAIPNIPIFNIQRMNTYNFFGHFRLTGTGSGSVGAGGSKVANATHAPRRSYVCKWRLCRKNNYTVIKWQSRF